MLSIHVSSQESMLWDRLMVKRLGGWGWMLVSRFLASFLEFFSVHEISFDLLLQEMLRRDSGSVGMKMEWIECGKA
jgi:hypothetical protein